MNILEFFPMSDWLYLLESGAATLGDFETYVESHEDTNG